MPRPIYLMLCHDAITDAGTKMLSAIKVIERVTIDDPALETRIAEANLSEGQVAIVKHEMACVAWLVRSNHDEPESSLQGRVGFRMPDGRYQLAGSGPMDFSSHTGVRIVTRLSGFPWGGYGLYWFVVQVRASDDDEWDEIAVFPLEVVDGSNPEAAEEEGGE